MFSQGLDPIHFFSYFCFENGLKMVKKFLTFLNLGRKMVAHFPAFFTSSKIQNFYIGITFLD